MRVGPGCEAALLNRASCAWDLGVSLLPETAESTDECEVGVWDSNQPEVIRRASIRIIHALACVQGCHSARSRPAYIRFM